MNELLDGVEKRGLLFLKALYAEERWWTEKELSAVGSCSSETTFRTIAFLKEFAAQTDQFFTITSKKNKGLFLETSVDHSIGEIEGYYIKRSLSYKILDNLFQKRNLNYQRLAKLLFVSPSTIYRKVKKIQLFLEENGLSLNLTNFSIAGPEWLVREFFYRVYWSVLKSGQWPFNEFSYQQIGHAYQRTIKGVALKLSKVEEIQFYYRLAINQIRHRSGFFIQDEVALDPYFQYYQPILRAFIPAGMPDTYVANETTFLTFALVANPIFDEQSDHSESRLFWHQHNPSDAYLFSTGILDSVKENCPQNLIHNEERLMFKLLNVYYFTILFSKLTLAHTNIEAFIKSFSQENTYFYQHIINSINNIRHLLPKSVLTSNINYLLYHLLLIFSSEIDVNFMNNRIYVKLSCTIEPLNEEYLKQFLIKKANQPLIVHTSHSSDIPLNQYDLLITDNFMAEYEYPSALTHCIWDYPPTQRDWHNILDKIDTIASHTLVSL